ncbi:MAG TPA: sodium/glutamate symporter [Candidatus Avamphibacillus sp.]|nr:sodium/glutamate symporter [Candidatus Avamphibacillus sp.]
MIIIDVMLALGLISIMICIGLVIRVKFGIFRKMLLPTSIIAGLIGLIVMNTGLITFVQSDMYVDMVNIFFTIVFISIGLTSTSKQNAPSSKEIAKGSLGMGIIWNIFYTLTPVIGALLLLTGIGKLFDFNPIYGLMIPFAFAQGPGQAATFGTIMEQQYGIADAAVVGITFASIGFIICFVIGVPIARYGIRKGLAKNMGSESIKEYVERGYYSKSEERGSLGKETMFTGNLDTMAFHFSIIGLCFVMAYLMASVISLIPGVGESLGGMLFIYGMFAAYIVKYVMKVMKIDYMLDNNFQSKFTGWATDYLIVTAFMSITFEVIGQWIIPILFVSIIVACITLLISIYLGQRIGGENDFERTLGLFGTSTGQVPSGIALVRIVDPALTTSTIVELGLMNLAMIPSYGTVLIVFGISSGVLSWSTGILLLLAHLPVFLVALKIVKAWGKPTFRLGREKPKAVAPIAKE